MQMPQGCVSQIAQLVALLVSKSYRELVDRGWVGRLTIQEIETAISEYGRSLVDPPPGFFDRADVYELTSGSGWHVDVPLWTAEEGESDLTLSLSVRMDGNSASIGISDLHVL
jgi:hypothetical protein